MGEGVVDTAIKVMTLPITIYEAGRQPFSDPLVRQVLGLGVVGSFLTTYTVKETLQDVLSSLQRVPGYTDISLAAVVELISGVLQAIATGVRSVLRDKGGGQLILVGHCPVEMRGRAFVLSARSDESGINLESRELFGSTDVEYFGDYRATTAAETLRADVPGISGWEVLKRVRADPQVRSVGGHLQYGLLDSADFRVLGVYDYEVDHDARELYAGFYIGGVEYRRDLNRTDSSLFVSHAFLIDQRDEINALLEAGYTLRTTPLGSD